MRAILTFVITLLISSQAMAQSFSNITAPTTDLPLNLFPVVQTNSLPKALPSAGMAVYTNIAPETLEQEIVITIKETEDVITKMPYGFQSFTQLGSDDRVLDWLEFTGEIPRTVYTDDRHRTVASFYGHYKTDRLRYYTSLKTNTQFDTATREALLPTLS